MVGDGEAETGPLATSWHSHRFLNPARDGAVLPILHLNGWKIANPAVLARIPEDELDALLRGYGYEPRYVTGHEPAAVHQEMAAALDDAIAQDPRHPGRGPVIRPPVHDAPGRSVRRWPMIVLRTPKGWTGPAVVDGLPVEGTWRAHQVPLAEVRTNPEHLRQLEEWMRSYRPEELFGADGGPREGLLGLVPDGDRRLGANPHANGGAAAARPGDARLPRLRGAGAEPGARDVGADPGARRDAPRRDAAQRAQPQLPRLSARTRPSRTG